MKVRLVGYTQPAEEFNDNFKDAKDLVAYCARVSNPSNQYNTETADKLIRYLIKNLHWSPLEMASATIEVETTRDIARQLLRHRSFCLGAESVIWFDLPDENGKTNYKPHKQTISYLWDRWHNGATELGNGQRLPMQERIKKMFIRCMDEETGEIIHTHINDITKNTAHLFKVTFSNGNTVVSSKNHKYYTSEGWLTLQEAIDRQVLFASQGNKTCKPEQFFPDIEDEKEEWLQVEGWQNYLVSNMGRLKRIGKNSNGKARQGSVGNHGYPRVSFNRPGIQEEELMHRLVMKTFNKVDDYQNLQVRHKNHNKLDCRLSNLEWGTDVENKQDNVTDGLQARLQTNFVTIVGIEDVGVQDSYDISVVGPFHNFVCDGMIVHNSFQEFSQRYANPVQDLDFVIREARLQDAKNRQSSLEVGEDEDDLFLKSEWERKQHEVIQLSKEVYLWAVNCGIAKEQARAVLPEGNTVSRMYVNGTIRSWIHYIQVRTDPATQKEHRELALEVAKVIAKVFPFEVN